MAVGRDYMLKKPSGTSSPKLFLDTQVVPLAANIAGSLEVALDRVAARTGVRPALILAGATGLIGLGLIRLFTHRSAANDRFDRF
ncbi:hypothetical protein SAMN02799622_01548 [Methylobacterium sp. UNC378MF]|uniref:hypothetical protein n=1 Tax=Methylobacterium sp. UNC378MF TaxID=1502748 RepID=UPI00088F8DCF|nr:hypothetical protein [Methylobacterium sp. UNC378MF]SDA16391.1 hypothetical protein SAMN02799622_01548 [Methylobacterium sp. UNC378MF]